MLIFVRAICCNLVYLMVLPVFVVLILPLFVAFILCNLFGDGSTFVDNPKVDAWMKYVSKVIDFNRMIGRRFNDSDSGFYP